MAGMGTQASIVSIVTGMCALVAGCDSKATASDPQGSGTRAEQRSKEYESCGASMHCQDGLRCFDQTCRRLARSTVGDYFAAVGAARRASGDHEAAIAAYASALGHYDAEKVPLPPDLDCAYGGALAAGKARKDHAELGARVLHRCVLAVPAGSSLRDRALVELATLSESGLDPLLLGAPKPADLYLTNGPARPATDKLTIAVSANPQPKNMQAINDKVLAPDVRAALLSCWEAYASAAKKDALVVTIGVKSSYVAPEYEDEAGAYLVKLDPPILAAGTPDGAADACVRQVIEPTLKAAKLAEAFAIKLTVTIK